MSDENLRDIVRGWIETSRQGGTSDTMMVVGKLLAAVAGRHLRYRACLAATPDDDPKIPGQSYFPAALVGLVLDQMREACPGDFSPLHIVARALIIIPAKVECWAW